MDFDPKVFKIKTPRTAHIFKAGNATSQCVWMMTHGYAMLADQLLRKFSVVEQDQNYFLAPEGLSKFYWGGLRSQEVVSSWMTKRERLDEIEDYTNYLEKVYAEVDHFNEKKLFGFSQGGTTMWRFIHAKRPDFQVFINWAGNIPMDIDILEMRDYLKNKKLVYVSGSKDEFVTPEKLEYLKNYCAEIDLQIDFHIFEGKHRIENSFLSKIANKYK